MLPESPPTPPICTRVLEPDEQWKADLRKRIEHDFLYLVEDAQIMRDTSFNSQPSESSRERAQRVYEESMDSIQTLVQEKFARMMRQEMSKRKRALDIAPFDPPSTSTLQNSEGSHSTSLQRRLDREREPLSDESSEDGYGTGGLVDEDDESDELGESADEEGEGEEDGDEGDPKSPQSCPPPHPSIPLTQTLHPKSPISRRNPPSRQRQPPKFQPAKDNDDDDMDDPHGNPPLRHVGQPYSPGRAPRRQNSDSRASILRSVPRTPEPPGISRTFVHVKGQEYDTGPVHFTRVSSIGLTSSGAGRHRSGSMNSDQYRSSSDASRGDAEHTSAQNRDRIASSTAFRERRATVSAYPYDKPSPPRYAAPARAITGARPSFDETVRSPLSASHSRAIYDLQRSLSQTEEGSPRTSWGSLNPRRSSSESNQITPEEGPPRTYRASLNLRRSFGDLNQTSPEGSRWTSRASLNSRRSFGDLTTPEEGPRETSRGSLNPHRSFGDLGRTTPEGPRGTSWGSLSSRRSFGDLRQTTPEEGPRGFYRGSLNSRRSFGELNPNTPKEGPRGTSRISPSLRRSFGELGQNTPEEGPWGTSRGSLNSRRSFGDFNAHRRPHSNSDPRLPPVDGDLSVDIVGQLDDLQNSRSMRNVRGTMSIEQLIEWENETRRMEEAAIRKEEEGSRWEEEARRLEVKALQSLEEARRLEAGARQAEASAKMREATAQNKEAKVKRKEAVLKKREADVQKREAEAQRKEENIRFRELETQLKEEQARRKEEAAQRKEDDARRREEEVRRKEEEAARREEEASRKEEEARRLEKKARQSLEEARRLEAGARQTESSNDMPEAAFENEQAKIKRDEIEVNFIAVAYDMSKT